MERTEEIKEVLAQKGGAAWSVTPDSVVYDALELMAQKNIGALLVMEEDRLVGIFSERDYARKVVLKGKSSVTTEVREIMSSPVTFVSPSNTIDECMRRMTDGRLRHLPVVDAGKVVGMVSIGDLVNWIISAQQESLKQLQGYIEGKYPG